MKINEEPFPTFFSQLSEKTAVISIYKMFLYVKQYRLDIRIQEFLFYENYKELYKKCREIK